MKYLKCFIKLPFRGPKKAQKSQPKQKCQIGGSALCLQPISLLQLNSHHPVVLGDLKRGGDESPSSTKSVAYCGGNSLCVLKVISSGQNSAVESSFRDNTACGGALPLVWGALDTGCLSEESNPHPGDSGPTAQSQRRWWEEGATEKPGSCVFLRELSKWGILWE